MLGKISTGCLVTSHRNPRKERVYCCHRSGMNGERQETKYFGAYTEETYMLASSFSCIHKGGNNTELIRMLNVPCRVEESPNKEETLGKVRTSVFFLFHSYSTYMYTSISSLTCFPF
jgi:hypothetical protein